MTMASSNHQEQQQQKSGSGGATNKRESIGAESTRRHSSTTQDLNEYIYSVAEEADPLDVADDDDVFEMDSSGVAGSSSTSAAAAAAAAIDAKRRTQSLGSLSGGSEPKSPRKVLSDGGDTLRQTRERVKEKTLEVPGSSSLLYFLLLLLLLLFHLFSLPFSIRLVFFPCLPPLGPFLTGIATHKSLIIIDRLQIRRQKRRQRLCVPPLSLSSTASLLPTQLKIILKTPSSTKFDAHTHACIIYLRSRSYKYKTNETD